MLSYQIPKNTSDIIAPSNSKINLPYDGGDNPTIGFFGPKKSLQRDSTACEPQRYKLTMH